MKSHDINDANEINKAHHRRLFTQLETRASTVAGPCGTSSQSIRQFVNSSLMRVCSVRSVCVHRTWPNNPKKNRLNLTLINRFKGQKHSAARQGSGTARMTRLGISRYEREQRTRRAGCHRRCRGRRRSRYCWLPRRFCSGWSSSPIASSPVSVARQHHGLRRCQNACASIRLWSRIAIASWPNRCKQIQQQSAQGDQSGSFLLQFYQQQLQQLASQTTADSIAQQTLDDMITDKLVRQEATKRGLTISADDVEKERRGKSGFLSRHIDAVPDRYAQSPRPRPLKLQRRRHTATATPQPIRNDRRVSVRRHPR